MYSCINGCITTENSISIFDRGFMFGDGLFETIRIVNGFPYLWQYHIARLLKGLSYITLDIDTTTLYDETLKVIKKNNLKDALVKITITRGINDRGYYPRNPVIPNIIISAFPYKEPLQEPVALHISRLRCHSDDPLSKFKTLQKMTSVLSKIEAVRNQCFEGLIMTHNNKVCEVSSGNIFWYHNTQLFTPSSNCGIIPGVMRRRIMEKNSTITGEFSLSELLDASSIFITNIYWIALPVILINPHKKTFKDHKITQIIREQIINDQNMALV